MLSVHFINCTDIYIFVTMVTFKCDECKDEFTTKKFLYTHKELKHTVWSCAVCFRRFKQKPAFDKHVEKTLGKCFPISLKLLVLTLFLFFIIKKI